MSECSKPYYTYRLENNLCVRCGIEPSRSNSRLGAICADRERVKAKSRKDRLRNDGLCTYCGIRPLINTATCSVCTVKVRAHSKASKVAIRDEVYAAYGGYVCKCCGETEPSFLSIDHINNDGAQHRREIGRKAGEKYFYWLKANGFPPIVQVLCMNCQFGKVRNAGICPHQKTKKSSDDPGTSD